MLPEAATGLGRAHDVVGHLDDVDADVDHGPAALQFLLAEDAPVGDAAAAEGLALDEHDLAELAFIAGLGEERGAGVEAVLEADGEFLPGSSWRRRSSSGTLRGSWPWAFP